MLSTALLICFGRLQLGHTIKASCIAFQTVDPYVYSILIFRRCAYQGVRNVHFSENLACFVFLKHPFWDSPFCLITGELLEVCQELQLFWRYYIFVSKNGYSCYQQHWNENDVFCKKCQYLELFWSVFSRIRTECGEIQSIQSKFGKIRTRITPNTDTFCKVLVIV